MNLELFGVDLSHVVIKEAMGVFLPLDAFDHQDALAELVFVAVNERSAVSEHHIFFRWYVRELLCALGDSVLLVFDFEWDLLQVTLDFSDMVKIGL